MSAGLDKLSLVKLRLGRISLGVVVLYYFIFLVQLKLMFI